MKLIDLAVKHSYYCSDNNFYSMDAKMNFVTFSEFYEEFHDADIDLNLVFRWDITKYETQEAFRMEIFMINQRKGIYLPVSILRVFEEDVPNVISFLKPHFKYLNDIWTPINTL